MTLEKKLGKTKEKKQYSFEELHIFYTLMEYPMFKNLATSSNKRAKKNSKVYK